jgi:hypothetical protein
VRKPGKSAHDKYQQLRRLWLRRMRRRFALVSGLLLLIVIAYNIVGIELGRAWLWSSGAVTGALLVALMAMRESPPAYIGNWQLGAWGEEATAKVLRPLEQEGWRILHDLEHEQGNIDHIAVGPGGVFLLNSKWLQGDVEVQDDGVLVRRIEDPELSYSARLGPAARGSSAELSQRLRAARLNNWVQPVIVISGRFAVGTRAEKGVDYVGVDYLAQFLRDRPARLTDGEIEGIADGVSRVYDGAAVHA